MEKMFKLRLHMKDYDPHSITEKEMHHFRQWNILKLGTKKELLTQPESKSGTRDYKDIIVGLSRKKPKN